MRVLVHDWSGHAFPAQLSRWWAESGHEVTHAFCATFLSPHGNLEVQNGDPPTLRFLPIDIGAPIQKYNYLTRLLQERRYGALLGAEIERLQPDVVLSNAPLDVLAQVVPIAKRKNARVIYWLQDVYSVAIRRYVTVSGLSRVIAGRYEALEKRLLRKSDVVLSITPDFVPLLRRWGVEPGRVAVQANWAPVDDVRPVPKNNKFAQAHGLDRRLVFMYAGTLGLKHDPSMLLSLARGLSGLEGALVVVVSDGPGADWLREHKTDRDPLEVMGFVDHDDLRGALGAADVLLALLEPGAGTFSVPSKVLSYLCSGRPILAAINAENLAARTIAEARAGVITAPGEVGEFVAAAIGLATNPSKRLELGTNARAYADQTFSREAVQPFFDELLASLA
jgi:colanic acid biosynthesis glycosyl transferase WcaI